MADERVVSKKLEQIEQYHGELVAKQQELTREEFLRTTTEQRAVERMFENVIQACADLAQHIATRDFDYGGDASKEAIRVLGRHGLLDEKTVKRSSQRSDSETFSHTSTEVSIMPKCTNSFRPNWRSTTPSAGRSPSGSAVRTEDEDRKFR